MIWWPFNQRYFFIPIFGFVVTHQWSGDLSIEQAWQDSLEEFSRNSPMIWWPFNFIAKIKKISKEVVTHQWSGDLSIKLGIPMLCTLVVTHQWSGDLSI